MKNVESVTCLENNAALVPENTATGGSFTAEMTKIKELRQEVTEKAGGSGGSWDWFPSKLGLGITRYLAIRYYHDILPTITIISRYSDSAIIDILQEISSTIHHDICVTEEIQNLLTALNPFHRNYKTLSINFT